MNAAVKVIYTIRNNNGYLTEKKVKFDRFETAVVFAKSLQDTIGKPIIDTTDNS